MLRAADMVVIVGTSLALTSGIMLTRAVAAGPGPGREAAQAAVRVTLRPEEGTKPAVRVVHPDHVRRGAEEAGADRTAGAEPRRWVDPYRIRRIVER
ncbi:hypothetical protein [Methylobacterium sp. sgz302541]|uniref:hypothetical protein n=1 Tax=unclassified Methylobacterium TaxID=2615210 RepID=UPI003D33B113